MSGQASFRRIADHIRIRIDTGVLKNGARLPSFQQLHRQFGASPNTVNKAYSALEADGLVNRKKRRGVFVSSEHVETRSGSIAMFVSAEPRLSGYWTEMLSGILSATRRTGTAIIYRDFDTPVDWTEHSGLLTFDRFSEASARENAPHGYPTVSLLMQDSNNPGFAIDDFQAGFLATQHLIDLGHRRIGVVLMDDIIEGALRFAGYRFALRMGGLAFDDSLVFPLRLSAGPHSGGMDVAAAHMDAMFDEGFRRSECTAMIWQNDWYAWGAMDTLQRRGLRVPDDISVVGFDIDAEVRSEPKLTSVGVDMFEIGKRGVEMLLAIIENPDVPQTMGLIRPKLVQGGSSGPLTSRRRYDR